MNDKTRKPDKPEPMGGDLDRDLGRIRENWKPTDPAEPPGLIDQAVRSAARRDLEEPVRKGRPLRWLGGLATAAVVVLALTVMLDQSPPGVSTATEPAVEKTLRKDPTAVTNAASPAEKSEAAEQKGPADASRLRQDALPAAPPRAMSREVRRQEEPLEEAFAEDEPLPAPEAWIEQMVALQRAGLDAELEEQITAFRAVYPEFPLPAELQERLP